MCANDTLIYVSGESSAYLEVKLNMVFSVIEHWMNINKFKMNAKRNIYDITIYDSLHVII